MIKSLIICAALMLSGCGTAPEPELENQIVNVKVYEPRPVPAKLAVCPEIGTLPVFLPVEGKPDWVALNPEGQHFIRDMLLAYKGCTDSWGAWSAQ